MSRVQLTSGKVCSLVLKTEIYSGLTLSYVVSTVFPPTQLYRCLHLFHLNLFSVALLSLPSLSNVLTLRLRFPFYLIITVSYRDQAGRGRDTKSVISMKPNKVSWPVPYNAVGMP